MIKNVSIENTVEFQDIDEFYLPKNCMICGTETENRIEKSEYGSYTSNKDYKKNYKLKLPVCEDCNSKINLKAGKSGIILFLGVLLGIILGIIVYYLSYSIILSIAIFTVLFIFPYLKYKAKVRPRIKLSDFLSMKVIPNEEIVQFTFLNKEYAKYVNKINSEKIKAEKIKAEKIKAEKIKVEKIEAEKIKEKEKSETVEKTPTIATGKSDETTQVRKSIVDGSIAMNSVILPTKEIKKIEELTEIPPIKERSKFKELIEIPPIKEIQPVTKKCPKCGSDLKPSWKFCVFCSEVIND